MRQGAADEENGRDPRLARGRNRFSQAEADAAQAVARQPLFTGRGGCQGEGEQQDDYLAPA